MNSYGAASLGAIPPAFAQRSITPSMPPTMYRTFRAAMPIKTHFRDATCEEADCEAYRFGWVTTVDTSTELGKKQYQYITHDKSRKYQRQNVSSTLIKFMYGPGQRCFGAKHKVPLERPPTFLVAGGDWRGYTTPWSRHTRAEFWAEEMQDNFDGLRTMQQRG